MGSPCPPHWTFAARAAYFGERMCAFCDHRNPAGAKFCNDCASPLHLKPCKRCDAVNDLAATNCYKCGAGSFSTAEATPELPATDSVPAWRPPDDVAVGAAMTRPPFAGSALRSRWGLHRPGQFLVAALATTLIVAADDARHIDVVMPDAIGVASHPVGAAESTAITAPTPAVIVAAESEPVEAESTAALQAPVSATNVEAPKRVSVRQHPVPVPATKRASAYRRPAPQRQASAGATPPAAGTSAAARVGAPVAQSGKALRPADQWEVMQVSLARCGGDLIARFVCDLRVRRHFCEGHWGETPACPSGVANEHAQ